MRGVLCCPYNLDQFSVNTGQLFDYFIIFENEIIEQIILSCLTVNDCIIYSDIFLKINSKTD